MPHLADDELNRPFLASVVAALFAVVRDLEEHLRTEADEQAKLKMLEDMRAPPSHDHSPADASGSTGRGAPVGRKPPALALAEEALAILHDVAKRKSAAGTLGAADGNGALILWSIAGLTGSIYPTLLSEGT